MKLASSTPVAPLSQIDLLRHGEPVGGRRYRGQVDDPLSEKGWRQMWDAVGEHDSWDQIVTSPLLRCSAFADALGEGREIPVRREPRLREVGFGEWEGRTPAELTAMDEACLRRFYEDPVGGRPPGAEPLAEFAARVQSAFDEILHDAQGRRILIVAHAGVIRAVVARVLQAPLAGIYRMSIPTAGMVTVRHGNDRPPTLVFPPTGRSVSAS